MGSFIFILNSPSFDEKSRCFQSLKKISIEALGAETSIEGFDEPILVWLPWLDEMKPNLVLCGPRLHCLRAELGSIIDYDRVRFSSREPKLFEKIYDIAPTNRMIRVEERRFPGAVIDYRQNFEIPIRRQPIVNKIHRPDVVPFIRDGKRES